MSEAIDYRRHVDPEYRRWGRRYGRFPGVDECVRLLREGSARGAWVDIISSELTAHAADRLPELIAAFRSEEGEWVRLIVLTAITEAWLPAAVPFLAEVVRQGHSRFVPYAERGLAAIGTPESRAALREAEL